ncbi:uncharacterized protein LOC115056328 [Echeneis naucrates]|uniref:Uncharacterized LOC115056328 n=1 Tax=Echeneis naucrates TaxID=173247 RepID=A0A665UW07_ECHNA|nr:uncharacterized protein LOC115056328 [Echeneis naucrates]
MESYCKLEEYQVHDLIIVYLVSLIPSVMGSFSVLVVSLVKWRHLRQQVTLLVQIALADLLAALTLIFTSVLNKVETSNRGIICIYSLPLSLTFYFISFLLMVVYAWKSKEAIQGWRARPIEDEVGQSQHYRTIFVMPVYGLAWLIPAAIYLAYVFSIKAIPWTSISDKSVGFFVYDNSTSCTSCILFLHCWEDSYPWPEKFHDIFINIFLFVVVTTVLLSCSVIYCNVSRWYQRHQHQYLFPVEGDGRSRRTLRSSISAARNMVMVILFCWTPALVLIVVSNIVIWANVKHFNLFGFYVIQAASVSLQGFLNSMVYAWRRPNFREAVLGENTPLVAQRLAFFDESLTNSC